MLLIAVSTYSLLQSLVIPVLPTLQHGLHTSQATVTWVLTAYLLSASVATPIVGRAGDIYGKKKILVATLATLCVGTLIAALAASIGLMIVARVIQGAGGAVLPLSFAIIREEFPAERVSGAIGFAAALLAVGGGAGIVLGGPIVDALNYHWLFWIPLMFTAGGTVATILIVPESESRAPGGLSWTPALLLAGWLVALIIAVSEGESWGWTSAATLGLSGVGVVLMVVWVLVELKSSRPLIDMRMMRVPAVWTTNLVSALFGVGLYASFGFLPEFLQTPRSSGYGFGASITASGFYLLPMTVTMFVFGLVSGRVAARIGSKFVLMAASASTIPPFLILAFAHNQQWEIYLASALLGIGLGFGFAAMSNLIVEAVPATQVGVASGMNANIRTIGGSVGTAVMATIVTSRLTTGGLPVESGYTHGFAFLALAAIMATGACAIIPSLRRSERATLDAAHAVGHAETALVAGAGLIDAE